MKSNRITDTKRENRKNSQHHGFIDLIESKKLSTNSHKREKCLKEMKN